MKSRICLVLFLQLCILSSRYPGLEGSVAQHRQHDYQTNAIPNHAVTDSEHKLLIECQHADYRTYIKCLKREKRHEGNQRSCLDECFEVNCTTSMCLRDCHTHCKKRLIETYSKTVETSFDCSHGECTNGSGLGNVTTIVNINNNMPNVTTFNNTPTHEENKPDINRTEVPKIDINNVINNQFGPGFGGGDCIYPNCYPFSPWQAMPQITIGIGAGPVGGCIYPMSWPCFQKYPAPQIDCSTCGNPFLRSRCEPACTQDSKKNNAQTTTSTQWPSSIHQSGNINGRRP